MSVSCFLPYLAVMAGVTYLIRALPFAAFNKKIKNRFVKSFLYYVPYAVLSVMTVPDIFFAPGLAAAGAAALVVAILLSYKEKGLLTVAVFSCITVYTVELIARLMQQ